ncbi:superfamily I DNA and/or RNA helicase [Mycoplasma testudineum]|uniref:Superfamily I DNA and/or RNA helicase n=1 Tax=Mycoplasma testudineum TaxID=244584 RepID=A0A4R6ID37_9MOLU|nr:AAA domain-containing protein [Mycoplasma testudineum]OYD26776.1 hypothetical protein CG473_02370 [Mycoplasma testudineum]TDO19912.1 superfamily I DNA and/or RNA helicase [Mycoplasma testudineum]
MSIDKYQRLLNNLLEIQRVDRTLYTRIDNIVVFDFNKKFGQKSLEKILNQKSFKINLVENDYELFFEKIKNCEDGQCIIDTHAEFNFKLSKVNQSALLNEEKFIDLKKSILENLIKKIAQYSVRWHQFRRKVVDINIQKNIWPLHVGTMFAKIKIEGKELYAPLIFKEVLLEMKNSQSMSYLTLESNGDWIINEKLIFMLNRFGYNFPPVLDLKEMNIDEVIEIIAKKFNLNYTKEILQDKTTLTTKLSIDNINLEISSGTVLGLFEPAGGNLKKLMLEIIEKNEVDDILDVNIDKSEYMKNVQANFENEIDIYKVQPADYSQEKAIVSSLDQSTVIWGPPGTGKSQVIANLIANILIKNKKAIVVSQKRAALEVLKKRLKNLTPFVFFNINEKNMDKSDFYKSFREFVKKIDNFQHSDNQEYLANLRQKNTRLSRNQAEAIKFLSTAAKEKDYRSKLNLIQYFQNNFTFVDEIKQLKSDYLFPKNPQDYKDFFSQIVSLNKIEKTGFFIFKSYPAEVKQQANLAYDIYKKNKTQFSLDEINKIKTEINLGNYKNLIEHNEHFYNQENFQDDSKHIESKILSKIMNNLYALKNGDPAQKEFYKDCQKFFNAVRAGRRLPFKFLKDHEKVIDFLFKIQISTPENLQLHMQKNYYDYVILDEASQMFVETGLPLLYVSKIKIFAGDNQQLKPSKWFGIREEANENEEVDLAEDAESLLDYGLEKGVYSIMLDKNYRAKHASLMSFSAKEFYEDNLDVVNQNGVNYNSIEIINVDGEWVDQTNSVEVDKVIEIANDNLEKYNSIILLTLNSNQKQAIESEIISHYPKLFKAIEDEKIMLRSLENIQGDEAELVIISVAYDKNTFISQTYVARKGGKNALNVAISRAQKKMIIVKSLYSNDLKKGDSIDYLVFRSWLNFLDLKDSEKISYSSKQEEEIEIFGGEYDSGFEQDVAELLAKRLPKNLGLKIERQYSVGSLRIDLAILDANLNYIIGIEVDGYRYHGGLGIDKQLADFSRQEYLEAKGYNITRILEISWYRDKEGTIQKIVDYINSNFENIYKQIS